MKEKSQIQPIELTKFNFDISQKKDSPLNTRKRIQIKDISIKRMKYCLKKISMQKKEMVDSQNSLPFKDNNYFDVFFNLSAQSSMQATKRSIHSSNLFRNDRNLQQNPQALKKHQIPSSAITPKYSKSSVKYLSGDILDNYSFSRQKDKPKTGRQIRPKSSTSGNRKQQKKINPYTNQEYLYFRKKQKERIKKTMQQLKKKQMSVGMIKPCRIQQKQLKRQTKKDQKKEREKKLGVHRQRKLFKVDNRGVGNVIVIEPWQNYENSWHFSPFQLQFNI